MMRYTLLGRSGLRVSEAALGTMTFGEAWGWGASEDECRRMFDAYADAGGNFVDTACNYTDGQSEEIVGALTESDREHFVIATKYTLTSRREDPNAGGNHRKNLVQTLEASLRRLRTDYVDLLQIHDVDRSTPIEESWGAVQAAIEEGKVRFGGLSNHPADLVERAHAVAPVTSCQEQLSLLAGPQDRAVLELAPRLGIGLLAWAPLASGFLVDGFDVETLHPDDFRRRSRLREQAPRIERLRAFAEARGRSLRELAIAWVLAQPGVTAASVGARSATEAAAIADGTDWRLTDTDLQALM